MTCIVAIAENDCVWMGCDSAGISGYFLTVRRDPKIYSVDDFLFGFTDSFRMGQLLGYKFIPPLHIEELTIEEYMNTEFIDAVRATLKDGGYAKIDNNVERGGNFLVGYRGRIFQIEGDYQVGENILPFDAVGCGAEIALGALSTTRYLKGDMSPECRLTLALEAAESFSAGVRGPFRFYCSRKDTRK